MKKTIITALVLVAGAVFATQGVAKKPAKVQTQTQAPQMSLVTPSDSMSYAAGKAITAGLIPYLQNELHVDTAYMADFVKGFTEAVAEENNPAYVARMAGAQIVQLARQRMIPSLNKDLSGTPVTLNVPVFYEGFVSTLRNDSTIMTQSVADSYFQTNMEAFSKEKSDKAKAAGVAWLAENAKKPGVITTKSGLQYKVITEGKGAIPTADQEVTVKYEGRLIDGTVFDSSYRRNPQTTSFRCSGVIAGWTEALTLMPVGSKWELYIPQELGYGSHDMGNIPAYSTLIFTVELVDIKK